MNIPINNRQNENPLQCSVCQATFTKKMELKRHFHTHGKKNRFQCDVCGQTFSKKFNFKRHYNIHSNEKPFICNICGQSFRWPSFLKEHENKHLMNKLFICSCCNETFTHRTTLRNHMMTHTGEKPHRCKFCGKRFAKNYNLKLHQRLHTGELPFQCDYCEKNFNTKSNLTNHLYHHTGVFPFICDVCQAGFRKKAQLLSHYDKHLKSTTVFFSSGLNKNIKHNQKSINDDSMEVDDPDNKYNLQCVDGTLKIEPAERIIQTKKISKEFSSHSEKEHGHISTPRTFEKDNNVSINSCTVMKSQSNSSTFQSQVPINEEKLHRKVFLENSSVGSYSSKPAIRNIKKSIAVSKSKTLKNEKSQIWCHTRKQVSIAVKTEPITDYEEPATYDPLTTKAEQVEPLDSKWTGHTYMIKSEMTRVSEVTCSSVPEIPMREPQKDSNKAYLVCDTSFVKLQSEKHISIILNAEPSFGKPSTAKALTGHPQFSENTKNYAKLKNVDSKLADMSESFSHNVFNKNANEHECVNKKTKTTLVNQACKKHLSCDALQFQLQRHLIPIKKEPSPDEKELVSKVCDESKILSEPSSCDCRYENKLIEFSTNKNNATNVDASPCDIPAKKLMTNSTVTTKVEKETSNLTANTQAADIASENSSVGLNKVFKVSRPTICSGESIPTAVKNEHFVSPPTNFVFPYLKGCNHIVEKKQSEKPINSVVAQSKTKECGAVNTENLCNSDDVAVKSQPTEVNCQASLVFDVKSSGKTFTEDKPSLLMKTSTEPVRVCTDNEPKTVFTASQPFVHVMKLLVKQQVPLYPATVENLNMKSPIGISSTLGDQKNV